jgi:hypothetical protein
MNKKYRAILIFSIFSLVLLELIYFFPNLFYYFLVVLNVALFFVTSFLVKGIEEKNIKFKILILPFLLLNSALFYAIISISSLLIQTVFIFSILLLFFHLRSIYLYYFKPLKKTIFRLEELGFFVSFLVWLFFLVSIFGLKNFLNLPIWQIDLILSPVLFVLLLDLFWMNKITIKKNIYILLLILLTQIEIVTVIYFLSFSYLILALIVAIIFYSSVGIFLNFSKEEVNKKNIRYYINFLVISLLLIFLSFRWL